jgi:hypothetical protein
VRTLYIREMVFGTYMIACALLGLRHNSHWGFSVYLSLQVSTAESTTAVLCSSKLRWLCLESSIRDDQQCHTATPDCSTLRSSCARTITVAAWFSPQGMAFLAFAFNLVDQGQLLGRPLDTHKRQLPAMAAPAARLQVRNLTNFTVEAPRPPKPARAWLTLHQRPLMAMLHLLHAPTSMAVLQVRVISGTCVVTP